MSIVTTVIPVYNGERFLLDTLESLARQTRKPDRIVLLDDCSNDQTRSLASNFQAAKVEVVKNERNLGLFGNHRRLLEFAKETDYLHILHADDLIYPKFFSELLPYLESAPRGSFAYCEHEFIDEAGKFQSKAVYPLPEGSGPIQRHDFLVSQSELRAIQLHSAVLKTNHQEALCQFGTDFAQVGDVAFHARWAAQAPSIFRTNRVLSQVRLHSSNATRANTQKIQSWVLDEWRAMTMVASLIEEPAIARLLRRQRLKCLWAARSVVKFDLTFSQNAEFAAQIRNAVRDQIGPGYWELARAVVWLRNACVPPN